MDLITFTDGIQSIQIKEHEYPSVDTKPSKPFVPLGESVVRHTETLFAAKRSIQEVLRDFIAPSGHSGVDPNDFESMALSTLATLTALTREKPANADQAFHATLQRALTILNSLQEDRQLLQSYLSALERV